MRKTLTLSLAALALCAGGAAAAQNATQVPERGSMRGAEQTRERAEMRATHMFARLDVNQDGQISSADREALANQRFDAADADGDGTISREEFAAIRENRQERMGERRERRAEMRAQAGQRSAEGGERMARRDGRRGGAMRGARGLLRAADADANGAVSQEEFVSAALARFDAADANNDGTLTREERRNARPEGRHGRGGARG